MNATLPARAAALRARLNRLHQMSSDVAEASELEGLRVDLARRVERFAGQVDKGKLLASNGIAVLEPASLTALRKKSLGVLERFSAAPKSATLKRGQVWRKMLDEIDTATRELNGAIEVAWKSHKSTVFAGEPPTAIGTKLAKTKANTDAFSIYKTLYGHFKAAFDILPEDKSVIEKVRSLGTELETAAKAFDFNVPTEVKAFLEAVQSVDGASLNLLTPAVLRWLQEKGSMDTYCVKSTDRT